MRPAASASDLERFRDDRGARWVAERSFVSSLREIVLPALDDLLANPPRPAWARLIKQSNYRRVLRLELPTGAVFLKAHAIDHFGRRIGQRFCGTRGENEWEKTRLLRSLGVATPVPLAAGALQHGIGLARSYYISAEVKEPRTMTAALAEERDAKRRATWLQGLGADLAVLHEHRLHHRDLHGNNAMISQLEDRPVWLDLHSLWRVPAMPPWSRMRSIAKLLASLDDELEEGEDELFLRAYLAASKRSAGLDSWLRRARKRALQVRDEQWRSREQRALSGGSKVVREHTALGRTWRVSGVGADQVTTWFQAALQANASEVLKDEPHRGRVVRLGMQINGGQDAVEFVVLKLELQTSIAASLNTRFGYSRARRAWIAAHGLRLRKVAAPAPLALLECRDGRTLFAMRALEEGHTLESFAAEEATRLSPVERRAFVHALAAFVARVHERGGHHTDLSAKNVFVARRITQDRFALVDLEDFRLGHQVGQKELVRALGQLNDVPPRAFAVRERLRWWARYRRARSLELSRGEERELLGAIDAFTRARVDRREGRWRAAGKRDFAAGYFPHSQRSPVS